ATRPSSVSTASTSSRSPRTATGSSSDTTGTPGSATRTDTAPDVRQTVLAQRAHPARVERARLPLAARHGADPLPAQPGGARRPAAARQGHALLGRHRLD